MLVQMASVLYNEGHFAAARNGWNRRCRSLSAPGFRYHEAVVVSNLAAIVVQQGELGHGRRLIDRGLVLCQEIDDLEGVATAYNIRGEIERRVGDLDRAETDLRATLATIDQRGFAVVSSDSLVGVALVQSARGLHDEAAATVAESIQRAEDADSPMAVARARLASAYVDSERGDLDAAGAALRAAGEEAERAGAGVPDRRGRFGRGPGGLVGGSARRGARSRRPGVRAARATGADRARCSRARSTSAVATCSPPTTTRAPQRRRRRAGSTSSRRPR